MKKVLALVCVVLPLLVRSDTVSEAEARAAAEKWLSENRDMDMNPGAITGIVSSADLGVTNVSYYVVLKKNGGRIVVSADTRYPPIMAFVQKVDVRRERCPVIPDMLSSDYSGMTRALNASTVTVSRVLKSGVTSVGAWARKNQNEWRSLLSTNAVLKSAVGSPSSYVLPGFEYGGKYTFWDQTDGGTGSPLFNGYLYASDCGGFSEGGKGLGLKLKNGYYKYNANDNYTRYFDVSREVPCGCVATAWAAAMQYMGVTGTVSETSNAITYPYAARLYSSGDTYGSISWSTALAYRNLIPGAYDWSILPSNLGGAAASVSSMSELSYEARELIARVAYNCGLLSDMMYGHGVSTAFGSRPFARIGGGDTISGFSGATYMSGWSISVADSIIRSGRPVVLGISQANESVGHCVLAVGRREKTSTASYTYIFVGWGGTDDGWYNTDDSVSIATTDYTFDTIDSVGYVGGYGDKNVPAYGRVSAGKAIPVFFSVGTVTNYVGFARTDDEGYFRSFYKSPSSGAVTQYVVADGWAVLTNLNRTVTDKAAATFSSGACGDVTIEVGDGIPGFDFAVSNDLGTVAGYAKAASVPLAVYSGNSDTGMVSDVTSVLSELGSDVMTCYATGLDGGYPGEVFVLDSSSQLGNSVTNWGSRIKAYWSYSDVYDNSKAAEKATR